MQATRPQGSPLGQLRQCVWLLIMTGLALLAIFPAGRLPNYLAGEIPADPPPQGAGSGKPEGGGS
jgi:hypothetical protein